jgi:hypothetical protein
MVFNFYVLSIAVDKKLRIKEPLPVRPEVVVLERIIIEGISPANSEFSSASLSGSDLALPNS